MVRTATSEEGRQPAEAEADQRNFANDAWSIPSYLLAGMLAYGGIGWLLSHWLHVSALFPIGLVLGLFFALYLVYARFGR